MVRVDSNVVQVCVKVFTRRNFVHDRRNIIVIVCKYMISLLDLDLKNVVTPCRSHVDFQLFALFQKQSTKHRIIKNYWHISKYS